MKLCPSQIKYLAAIKELIDNGEKVRCVTIANHLGVSRPSVSKMLRCLADFGLLNDSFCYSVELTDSGKTAINELFANYNEIFTFFHKILHLPSDDARQQSLTFISSFPSLTGDRLADALRKSINKSKN